MFRSRDIGRQIARASPSWLLASIVVSLSIFVARALRWTWILRPLGRVPFLPAFRTTSVGFAANTVLPARAGEVIRPALLARERGLPFSALLASIVFERILDALAQLLFLGIALSTGVAGESGALSSGRIRWVVAGIAAVAVGVALFAVRLARRPPSACSSGSVRILPARARPDRAAHRAHVPGRIRLAQDAAAGAAGRRRLDRACGESSTSRSTA